MPALPRILADKPYLLAPVVIVLLAGGYFVTSRGSAEATLTIRPADFLQQVSVSGKVVAAQDVTLGFAQTGRVAVVYASVGDQVWTGALLTSIENGDAQAAVAQKQAARETQVAKLASLTAGSRPEQIAIDQTTVAQDEAALRNAIRSAAVVADDAVHKKADQFFTNGRTASAALALTVPDSALVNRLITERVALEPVLLAWQQEVLAASFTTTNPEAAATTAKQRLAQVETFLADASTALGEVSASASLSQATLDTYRADINTARTNVSSAFSSLTTAETALAGARGALVLAHAGASASDIAAQAAEVKAAEADLENAKAQLAKTRIIAPFSGVVTRVDAKVGQIVSPNTPEISLIGNGAFQIESYVPEINIALIKVDDGAAVTLDAYGPDVSFSAKIVSIDPAETLQNGVSTYRTLLQFAIQDPRIKSGMTASVVITTLKKSGVIAVPQALVINRNGTKVVRVKEGGRLVDREVTTGDVSSVGQIEITSGLVEGDILVLGP